MLGFGFRRTKRSANLRIADGTTLSFQCLDWPISRLCSLSARRPIRPFESLHSSVSKLLVTCRAVSRSEERQHLYLTNSASTEKPSNVGAKATGTSLPDHFRRKAFKNVTQGSASCWYRTPKMTSRLDEMSPTRLTRCHKERTMKTKFSQLALIAAISLAAAGTSYAHEDYSEAGTNHWLSHVSET